MYVMSHIQAAVDRIFKSEADEIVTVTPISNMTVKGLDIKTLQPREWLNDTVRLINEYMPFS